MKSLILTIGLPRAGKSTWSRQQGYPIVNPDSIRLALHGKTYFPPAEPQVWQIAKIMVKSLFLAGHDTVILDATNLRAFLRAEWESPDWRVIYKVFDTDMETCIHRAKDGGREDLVPVIERMAYNADPLPMGYAYGGRR